MKLHSSPSFHIGCDIGGTFTDVVAIASDGTVFADKADTTPADLSAGLLAALENLAGRVGLPLPGLLGATTRFVNGTTVVTNSIAELRGATVGLVTTKGFGDNLLIARSARNAHRDNHKQVNLPQLVAREHVVEVEERIDRKGRAVVPLTEAEARRAVGALVAAGVDSIAVSLLWSFANPAHEELIARIVEDEHPGLFLSVSSRLHPVIREYERTMTTVLNAFTGLRVAEYTSRIEDELARRGLTVPVGFMQGFGGTVSAEEARTRPITLVDSGPAGGVIGARALARTLGLTDIVTADMGGTSFDVSVLENGTPRITQRALLGERFLTALAKIDVLPIGTGGGSIAWVDARGVPQAGPRSAGAEPGPICYGKGGTQPTVTDASAVLGLLGAESFLGGRRALDVAAARDGLEREIGKPLGVDAAAAAAAVHRMVIADMSNAVRAVTVERGHDPRRFAMVAYGGALGTFAADIARSVGIRQVVIPAEAAVFSARGLLAGDDVRTRSRSAMWQGGDATAVIDALRELDEESVSALRAAGHPENRIDVVWQGEFKFAGQQWELQVPIPRRPGGDPRRIAADLADIQDRFAGLYEAEYGPGTAWVGSPVVLMSVRVVATGRVPQVEVAAHLDAGTAATPSGTRRIHTDGRPVDVAVYDAQSLPVGSPVEGPAVLEHPLTTIRIPSGWRLRLDGHGHYLLTESEDVA
ncbi:hydantoinase/oxoprolinase family protein [Amycolatopsis eburnea]|uniref:Hydantoinase/oxoprolinase family protein n=1 Tax=Amycolatopsis eburnea TaxID=2267691 RepID=A0A427SYF4_9PSEU|nr:hydantoinase/oxoprolinase family protein [Amycolatopsis eburnea]RSD10252.1 hydantoinase/oxoprolinase family protein [Amycolatopsis eburnea]